MKAHEFTKLENKLELRTRNSGDRLAWFEHEGKVITRTRRSHGSKDVPTHLVRQQLKLKEHELREILRCKLYRTDYLRILADQGLL